MCKKKEEEEKRRLLLTSRTEKAKETSWDGWVIRGGPSRTPKTGNEDEKGASYIRIYPHTQARARKR